MALGIQTEANTGNFAPILKYDAKAGRFFRVDRSQDASGNWVKNDVDITQGLSMVMDLAQIEVGWISFSATGPVFVLGKVGAPIPPRPEGVDSEGRPAFKQGFRAKVKLAKSCGGDVRDWAHTAKAVLSVIDDMHSVYLNAPEAGQGKLSVLKLIETIPIKTMIKTPQGMTSNTNYAPRFEIASWIDRPSDLPLSNGAPHAATAPNAGAYRGASPSEATKVPPPVHAAQAAPVRQQNAASDIGAEF